MVRSVVSVALLFISSPLSLFVCWCPAGGCQVSKHGTGLCCHLHIRSSKGSGHRPSHCWKMPLLQGQHAHCPLYFPGGWWSRFLHSGVMQIVVRENLRERCLGDLEGLTRTEARTTAPEAFKAFMKNDDYLPIPVRFSTVLSWSLLHGMHAFKHPFAMYSTDLDSSQRSAACVVLG